MPKQSEKRTAADTPKGNERKKNDVEEEARPTSMQAGILARPDVILLTMSTHNMSPGLVVTIVDDIDHGVSSPKTRRQGWDAKRKRQNRVVTKLRHRPPLRVCWKT